MIRDCTSHQEIRLKQVREWFGLRCDDCSKPATSFSIENLGHFLLGKKAIGKLLICHADPKAHILLTFSFFPSTLIGDEFQGKIKGETAKAGHLAQAGDLLRERVAEMKRVEHTSEQEVAKTQQNLRWRMT